MRILIADDEPISRKMLENSLGSWGYEVVATRDGHEAWEILQGENRPSLAVLDWMMPGMDGVDICRRLREQQSESYVYVILLTARNQTKDIVQGLESGADDYMVKPFHAEELKYRLRIGQRIIEQEQRILRLASTDDLTGLLTRRAFRERLDAEMSRSQREEGNLGIIIGDIDHFKRVNDTFGHLAGDQVLQYVSQRLLESCRIYDFVGRYGGEEFIVGVPGASLLETAEIAERMRYSIEESRITMAGKQETVAITASFGVDAMNLATGRDRQTEEMINAADEALYMAKTNGRNQVVVYPSKLGKQ
ncbi:MAG TPA: diguanylate cyclase [Syntrophomonadaceae bacterium]|nr:diguanylate cyclase [Syntrophomonadaceae bacterium]